MPLTEMDRRAAKILEFHEFDQRDEKVNEMAADMNLEMNYPRVYDRSVRRDYFRNVFKIEGKIEEIKNYIRDERRMANVGLAPSVERLEDDMSDSVIDEAFTENPFIMDMVQHFFYKLYPKYTTGEIERRWHWYTVQEQIDKLREREDFILIGEHWMEWHGFKPLDALKDYHRTTKSMATRDMCEKSLQNIYRNPSHAIETAKEKENYDEDFAQETYENLNSFLDEVRETHPNPNNSPSCYELDMFAKEIYTDHWQDLPAEVVLRLATNWYHENVGYTE
ncbi:uncharacterized protein LOC119078424 [Bradysia coprophila]|uniref:uncharacterized protein LOC119078424 n=1 Tax=Bradysia coprophila TaxID=38358 RepID=UPI00187D7E67|nr:uncharacterized protein LOC119078424 [Bradysia coprophila]